MLLAAQKVNQSGGRIDEAASGGMVLTTATGTALRGLSCTLSSCNVVARRGRGFLRSCLAPGAPAPPEAASCSSPLRLMAQADYSPLNGIARNRINTRLIERNWDDLLRVAGALKTGTVGAHEIMRLLTRGGGSSRATCTLARAVGEVGRVAKTLFLLPYIDDEGYRRRVLLQLNRHEGRHTLARRVFHGRRGEVRKRYREGQEDQLGALGLVVNAIVLWNTRHIQAALDQLRAGGFEIREEDVARLSPLGFEHINMLGRYHVDLAESVARGEMRPLRQASGPDAARRAPAAF